MTEIELVCREAIRHFNECVEGTKPSVGFTSLELAAIDFLKEELKKAAKSLDAEKAIAVLEKVYAFSEHMSRKCKKIEDEIRSAKYSSKPDLERRIHQ